MARNETKYMESVIALSEELAEFERPLPVMDDYDLLLAAPCKAVIQ